MKVIDWLILIFLLGLLIAGSWFLWINLPMGSEEYGGYSINLSDLPAGSRIDSNYTQFYPNMRYKDKNISYWIEPACGETKTKAIIEALGAISNKTVLTFYLDGKGAEIRYLCSRTSPTPEQESHYIAGEGGPVQIVNASMYSVILIGEVALYRAERCDRPQVAIHETLHALGFNHNPNPKSILYPVTDCKQEIDEYISRDINNIYVTESLPDLAIENVKADKAEGYLSFDITMANIGLEDAEGVKLSVRSDGTRIKEYGMGNIPIGSRKSLKVSGVVMPIVLTTNKLVFEISTKDSVKEISSENNRVELSVA